MGEVAEPMIGTHLDKGLAILNISKLLVQDFRNPPGKARNLQAGF